MPDQQKTSFFKEILKRRMLQIAGLYLGATVALMEFSGMIIERYGFSDNLVDYVLAAMLTMIPGMLILAWRHGAPGKDEWGNIEKVTLPTNLLVLVGVLLFLVNNSSQTPVNTSARDVTSAITKQTESTTIPRIGILFFEYQSSNASENWLGYASTLLLSLQLRQSDELYATSLFDDNFYWEVRRAGFKDGLNIPLSLARRVALNSDLHFFIRGSLKKNEKYELNLEVYETSTSKKIKTLSISDESLFVLTDKATNKLQNITEIPIEPSSNLNLIPASEHSTNNLEALEAFVKSLLAKTFDNDYQKATEYAQNAINLDPSFALAHIRLGHLAAEQGLLEQTNMHFRKALTYDYKLTPRLTLSIRASIHATEQNAEEQINLFRNWIELYPNDYEPKNNLALILQFRTNDRAEIIQLLKDSLALNPAQPQVYQRLGEAYLAIENQSMAKKMFQKHRELRPKSYRPLLELGKIELNVGNLEAAEKFFVQASLLEGDKVSPILALANLAYRRGDLKTMQKKLDEAALISQAPRQLARLKQNEMGVAILSGQPQKAYSLLEEFQQSLNEFEEPLDIIFGGYVSRTEIYLAANKRGTIENQLQALKQKIDPSLQELVDFGTLFIQIQSDKFDEAQKTHIKVKKVVERFNLRQLNYLLLYTQARIDESKKQWNSALKNYTDATRNLLLSPSITPNFDALLEESIIRTYRKSGEIQKAIEVAESYLSKWPFHPDINLEYAKSLIDLNKHDDALIALSKVELMLADAEVDCFQCKELSKLKKMLNE
ncbi:tetratricopeptide repeat protein [Pleionea sediminis]|uniref:tetratricopeptide repeat protein n=1 Tax=Pleionea sediminis TaxID=2569479 RepID=UPI0011847705|nr:tetratricopeptide repeat protein [Pleionea sediminis]